VRMIPAAIAAVSTVRVGTGVIASL
jgi:hypothetical protein